MSNHQKTAFKPQEYQDANYKTKTTVRLLQNNHTPNKKPEFQNIANQKPINITSK